MTFLLTASVLALEDWNEWGENSFDLRINATLGMVPSRNISPLGTRISKQVESRVVYLWKYKFAKWITEHWCQYKSQVEFHRYWLRSGDLDAWNLMGHALGISESGKLKELRFCWGRMRSWYKTIIKVLVNATRTSKVAWNKLWTRC